MDAEILQVVKSTRDSSFNRYNYSVTKFFHEFVGSMYLHTCYDLQKDGEEDGNFNLSNKDWLEMITPEFQRKNNKWSKSMKQKYIENVLSGCQTDLLFFNMGEHEDAQVIDGLQRISAIVNFFAGKVKPFGYTYEQLKPRIRQFRTHITIKIYTFTTWTDVGKFYIDMNENITHSKKDIQKAKDWFLAEHGIEL